MSLTKKGQYTPRETAFDIVIEELYQCFHGCPTRNWLNDYDDRPHMQRKIKVQIAKLHNKLLKQSGLDGLELEVE